MSTWTFTIPGREPLVGDDLSSGETVLLFQIVNEVLPHAEDDIAPAHCPACRSGVAIVALMRHMDGLDEEDADAEAKAAVMTLKLNVAAGLVSETPTGELKKMIGTVVEVKPPAPAARGGRRGPAPAKKPVKKAAKKSTRSR